MSSPPPRPPLPPLPPGRDRSRPTTSSTGAVAWGMGLLVLICVPFVSSVLAGVVMALVGRTAPASDPVAAENDRRAANWGLTYLLATVVLVGGHFTLLFLLTRDGPIEGFFPFGIIITAWVVVTVGHLVVSVVGLLKATRGVVFGPPAIPFLREAAARGPAADEPHPPSSPRS